MQFYYFLTKFRVSTYKIKIKVVKSLEIYILIDRDNFFRDQRDKLLLC